MIKLPIADHEAGSVPAHKQMAFIAVALGSLARAAAIGRAQKHVWN